MRIAFVLLETAAAPSSDDVLAAYRAIAPKGPTLLADIDEDASDDRLSFRLGATELVTVALMPVPVPDGEADQAARFSVAALSGGWKLAPHGAHLIVVFQAAPDAPAFEWLGRFTRILSAVAEAGKAVGVYWGDAGATHPPELLRDVAADEETLPVLAWTGVSVAADGPGRVSLLSLGLPRQLGFEDLMLTAPRGAAGDAIALFFDLIAYAARRGTPVPEGETVGRTEGECIPVRNVVSPTDKKLRVWRVDLD